MDTVTNYGNRCFYLNENLFSHSFGGQDSEISFTGPKSSCCRVERPPEVLGETPFILSSYSWGLLLFLACGCIIQSLLLYSHCLLLFHLCQISLYLSFVRTLVIACKAYLDNSGWSPHFKIFNLIIWKDLFWGIR